MNYVIVYTKARAREDRGRGPERVWLHKKLGRLPERWFGQRWRRGWWTAVHRSSEAELFSSVKAAMRIIQTALWCRFAAETVSGESRWRASIHVVKERPRFFNRALITAEVWPEAQAIDALAAIVTDTG
jgi:hypothetical protein